MNFASRFTGMTALPGLLACCAALSACGGTYASVDALGPLPPAQIQKAVSQIDSMAADLMQRSGVPGMSVAVVKDGRLLYAKGFGVRAAGSPLQVDGDTVFQLASVSKPIGASVVAQQVGAGRISWDTPVRKHLPWFTLASAQVSENVTIGDLYAHRSGLPDHAGDMLEELDYSQDYILRHLNQLPLKPFRTSFIYTNYGITASAMAVAAAAGSDWATLSEEVLYRPLGMASTSSRFADFQGRSNRALGHVKENGVFVVGPEAGSVGSQQWAAYDTDRQSPSGGVSSSAKDMAKWMSFVLAQGRGPAGQEIVPAAALSPALAPQTLIYQAQTPSEDTVHYGYGFFINPPQGGRVVLSHGGAFSWGASTMVSMIPSAGLGIVVLTNTWPTGVAEALVAQFNDIAQYGEVRKDWFAPISQKLAVDFMPKGALIGKPRPSPATPPQVLASYAATYANPHFGDLRVLVNAQGTLELRMGPALQRVYPLQHWDGDTFVFSPVNDSATPGSLSQASFNGRQLTLEHFNSLDMGVFTRAMP